jgi:hypothetical protein
MGNFYTNIVVAGASQSTVADLLSELRRVAVVSPSVNGRMVVYDKESDTQNVVALSSLAARLSERLSCPAWAVLNHDDDILAYELYLGGVLVDEYDSTPDYFDPSQPAEPKGGDAARLAGAFGSDPALSTIEKVLRREAGGYVFAAERHKDLAEALGIPPGLACFGYNYFETGAVPEGFGTEQFAWVPPKPHAA